jgi:hypothetical protein
MMSSTPMPASPRAKFNLWGRLTQPSAAVLDPHERRNARLTASLLVVIVPLVAAVLIGTQLTGVGQMSASQVVRLNMIRWGLFAILLGAYALTRMRYHKVGSALVVMILWGLIYASTILNPNSPYGFGAQVLLQVLPILIASIPVSGDPAFPRSVQLACHSAGAQLARGGCAGRYAPP